jgi:cytoskeletal protein CcmA (bactofilin family)
MFNRVTKLSTFIGADNTINGDITATQGDIFVAGRVCGSVSIKTPETPTSIIGKVFRRPHKCVVYVQVGGEVEGPITAETVIIDGKVNGNVFCTNLEVGAKGSVKGDVAYSGNLKMSPGARIHGHMVPTTSTAEVEVHTTVEPTIAPVLLVEDRLVA